MVTNSIKTLKIVHIKKKKNLKKKGPKALNEIFKLLNILFA